MIKLTKFQRWNIKGVITPFEKGTILKESSLPEKTVYDMLRLGYAEKVKEEIKEISKLKMAEEVENKAIEKKDISNKKLGKRGRPKTKGVK
jgi:hypothetical protein